MSNEVQKPMSVAKEELMDDIVSVINEAPLPFFVIEYVIRDVYDEVKKLSQKQYEHDKEKYESALADINVSSESAVSDKASKKDVKNK